MWNNRVTSITASSRNIPCAQQHFYPAYKDDQPTQLYFEQTNNQDNLNNANIHLGTDFRTQKCCKTKLRRLAVEEAARTVAVIEQQQLKPLEDRSHLVLAHNTQFCIDYFTYNAQLVLSTWYAMNS